MFGQSDTPKITHVSCPTPDSEITLHGSASSSLPILEILQCGEQVTVSAKEGEWYRVHSQSGKDGYVRVSLIALGDTSSSDETSSLVKEIPPGTVLKQPSRMPVAVGSKPSGGTDAYPLSIRVLQTEQVPYSVQFGGGQVATSCAINGTTNTTGSVIGSGDVAFGSSTAVSNLRMNCNSYETPPAQWRHVLNAMLVVASNGNAYIMACDAAWRWSKCRGLVVGDTFQAKMTSKGVAVEYLDGKGKPKEATYVILQSKASGN